MQLETPRVVSATTWVRPLAETDVPFAAQLHRHCLPHGFFPQLGPAFLRRYYRTFVDSPHAIALLATVNGRPAGVLVGTVCNGRHYAWVIRHRWHSLVPAAVWGLLRRPSAARLFLRTRLGRYVRGVLRLGSSFASRLPDEDAPTGDVAVLTHVSVAAATRGQGAGRALTKAFASAAADQGATRAELVTLAGPAGAAHFYRQLGWRDEGTRLDHDGRGIITFSKALVSRS